MTRLRAITGWAAGLAAVLCAPGIAMAEGLPQLDFANKLTTYQVVWGVVIFVILYILASRTALPKVEAVLEERARRIAGDLEGARDAKSRADSGIRAAADATAKARSEAQAAINAALESSKAAAAVQSVALNDRASLSTAEKSIRPRARSGVASAAQQFIL